MSVLVHPIAVLPLADDGWGGHMGDWGAGWWVVMVLMMVLFWGLLIVGAVWLVRTLTESSRGSRRSDAADILDRRLASGEITSDEYRELRAALRAGPES